MKMSQQCWLQNHRRLAIERRWAMSDCHHIFRQFLCKSWHHEDINSRKSLSSVKAKESSGEKLFVATREIEKEKFASYLRSLDSPSSSSTQLSECIQVSKHLTANYHQQRTRVPNERETFRRTGREVDMRSFARLMMIRYVTTGSGEMRKYTSLVMAVRQKKIRCHERKNERHWRRWWWPSTLNSNELLMLFSNMLAESVVQQWTQTSALVQRKVDNVR